MWTIGGDSVEMLKYICGVGGNDPGISPAAFKITLTVVVGLGVWAYHHGRGWYQARMQQTPAPNALQSGEEFAPAD